MLAEFTPLLSSAQQLLLLSHCRAVPRGLFRLQRNGFFSWAHCHPQQTGFLFMRKKGKAEGCLDHNYLLSARHCSKHFTCRNSLEPHNNPAMWVLINYYRKWRLEYVRHLSHSQ